MAHLVLPDRPSPNLFYKIPDNITSRRHRPVRKVVNSINKNLLLLDSKILVSERIYFLLRLSKTAYTPGHRTVRAFVMLSCISVIRKLPSLNCSNCGINPSRFDEFITHFVVVVIRVEACFGAGRALVRDIGYTRFT